MNGDMDRFQQPPIRDAGSRQPGAILEDILTLKHSSLFASVPTRELEAVALVTEEQTFGAGETIVREGDVGDSLYLIKKGVVVIKKRINAAESATLAELGSGECFGEMSVIDEEVRSASVLAKERCMLLRISKEALLEVIIVSPDLGVELLRIFVKRLRAANERIQMMARARNV
jgi:CRP/FNR family cyclic AMP-dependent transcriptional regulator